MSSEAEGLLASTDDDEPVERMDLQVEIRHVGPCRKHISVTVSEADVVAVRENCVKDLADQAHVPGFRVGKVPRQLLVKKFRDEISAQIKQKVLLASLEQLSAENDVDPINEPKIDVESLEVPDSGDFHYEFEVEVRPEFGLPDFSAITIRRPSGEISDEEFQAYRQQFLFDYATFQRVDRPAAVGDYVLCDLMFSYAGASIRQIENQRVPLVPALNFQDAALEGFDQLMAGAVNGDARETSVRISRQSPIVEMRGEEVQVRILVTAVEEVIPPVIDHAFLEPLKLESAEDLDRQLRLSLQRQVEFQQRQSARQQVLNKIAESADWDLPESLVRQQTENALRRELLEMAQAGFTKDKILARENDIRRDAINSTRQALKEHFVLDRLATENEIECTPADVDRELALMSFQSGEPLRKIRARLQKSGMIENLEAQLRERKAVDFILSHATFEDVPREPMARNDSSGLRLAICGNMAASLVDDSDSSSGDAE